MKVGNVRTFTVLFLFSRAVLTVSHIELCAAHKKQRCSFSSFCFAMGTVRQRMPGFMRESPLDGDVTRRVKRYANHIDRFRFVFRISVRDRLVIPKLKFVISFDHMISCSIRLGIFLRRYPIARVFVILYMVRIQNSAEREFKPRDPDKMSDNSLTHWRCSLFVLSRSCFISGWWLYCWHTSPKFTIQITWLRSHQIRISPDEKFLLVNSACVQIGSSFASTKRAFRMFSWRI